jgi:type VI secretion system protein ImpG
LFVDFDLDQSLLQGIGNRLELFVYFDRRRQELEPAIDADTLRLGCCPIVNLFRQLSEPIRLTHYTPEYRVVPDARRPLAREVYSIDRVSASVDNRTVQYRPFYSLRHADESETARTFWHASRRPAPPRSDVPDKGTEVYLSLVDFDFSPAAPAEGLLNVETTCTNRDLPGRIGGSDPRLRLVEGGAISRVRCITPLSPTLRPPLRHGARWRLVSHLTLNHIALTDAEDGASALREILSLYDFADIEETRRTIEGLQSAAWQRVVRRVGGPISAGLCRGMEVTLHLDEDNFTGGGIFLFASVLERFLGLYCSINSFTQTVATTNRRDGVLHRWPPRAGEKTLL